MKKTTNRIQENYMKARALVDMLRAEETKIEQMYIREHGIVNPDGEILAHIWMIEDEESFNIANESIAPIVEMLGIPKAEKILHEAENDLIRFGLALVPAKERQVLVDRCFGMNGHYVHIDIREKCIDLALKLDVSTIPGRRTAQ
jgi:hypothetical protein